MRRIIEKLTQERREKEEEFARQLKEIKEKKNSLLDIENKVKSKKFPFFSSPRSLFKSSARISRKNLEELQMALAQSLKEVNALFSSLAQLLELQVSLMDAKDKEWDALGSNHVGMIFKSMEWRVDQLASEYKDVQILMKKFLRLKETLHRVLAVLEKNKLPSPPHIREILAPLEDWPYAGFENRYRGSEEEVKRQQESLVSYFKKGGTVLDLGCGRGEFLELLERNGIKSTGIEINSLMVDICLDKGLHCQKGDILEKLAEWKDNSLDGIFSSQVIEHLPPASLKRIIELSYWKLVLGGVLVLETINPASVFALVQIYFLDLSHKAPVHPQALKFLLEASGFVEVEIKYSNELVQERLVNLPGTDETSRLLNQNIDSLNKLLYAAPNYAAIGKKK
ncbi:MAG: class I SAM-dependent methyltransferase [Candidatus Aminicenantales bacterium]